MGRDVSRWCCADGMVGVEARDEDEISGVFVEGADIGGLVDPGISVREHYRPGS